MFNEVFLDDVFVPDDCVVGEPTAGWECARTTLANERVSMAGPGSSFGPGVAALFDLAGRRGLFADPLVVDELGSPWMRMRLPCSECASPCGRRGGQTGPEVSVRKLLGVHQTSRTCRRRGSFRRSRYGDRGR